VTFTHPDRRSFLRAVILTRAAAAERDERLDARGRIHIPIGVANTLDALKTFVEAEGNFSPGFGSYCIYFWLFDKEAGKLEAPTMGHIQCEHGLSGAGYLIPWSRWKAGPTEVRTEVCEVRRGEVFLVGARVELGNSGDRRRQVALYAALRLLGPAGWQVDRLEVSAAGDALLVDGRAAMVAGLPASQAGVLASDTIGEAALAGKMPSEKQATSITGDCSGALRFDLTLPPGSTKTLEFVCPVLPGRRAAPHKWVDLRQNAMVDMGELNSTEGILQPDPGLPYYRGIRAAGLFREAAGYWEKLVGRVKVEAPDPRWGQSLRVVLAHAAMSMNEGAPDVAVANYNVFNRDGVYVANMLQKSGQFALAGQALDYFLAHPFNGRAYPEADNPGQVLWSLGQQWLFARDEGWVRRVYPSVRKLAAMISYYRTAPAPHWVNMASLEFGEALGAQQRQELKPGRCDGYHPEYTEAFDIAGLRSAAILAQALGSSADAASWIRLAEALLASYDQRFGSNLPRSYGSYAVLWPCRLYPLDRGKAYEQFKNVCVQTPKSWRYFPLATAHQGLLAGNRAAGHGTLAVHLDHEQMRGWYAFDEGGGSGSGGWHRVRTTWTRSVEKPGENRSVAMPHGWAIAEFWLLLRDCLVFEDRDRLVLLAGVPPEWFRHPKGIKVEGLETCFGTCSFHLAPRQNGALLRLTGAAAPPGGFVVRLPGGDHLLAPGRKEALIRVTS